MDYNGLNNMCDWERTKALYLISIAQELDMDLDSYGEINVNNNSGYTYLWLENYPFTLYMPIDCELTKDCVNVMWINFENGEEIETSLSSFTSYEPLNDILNWISDLESKLA